MIRNGSFFHSLFICVRQGLFALVFVLLPARAAAQIQSLPDRFFERDSVRILITDSGLGGFSVAAGIDSLLSANRTFRQAEVIFCNALPESNFRYNQLPDAEAKAKVFSGVLQKMNELFRPDIILIACNTLSVVYPLTDFSKTAAIPVLGIVELGTQAIADSMHSSPSAFAIILGTETTIQSDAHLESLARRSIPQNRVFVQACPNLESEIQAQPDGDMTANLIDFYVDELHEKLPSIGNSKVFAALCCTHYGYARDLFKNKMQSLYPGAALINPNDIMRDLFSKPPGKSNIKSKVVVRVYSQAALSSEERTAIGRLIAPVSKKSAKALSGYKKLKGVF